MRIRVVHFVLLAATMLLGGCGDSAPPSVQPPVNPDPPPTVEPGSLDPPPGQS